MLLLAFLYCVIVSSTYTYDVPLVAWAGKDLFKGENVVVSQYVSSFDSEVLLRSFVRPQKDGSALSQYLDIKTQPEVLVVFAESELRSEQLSTYAPSLLKFRNIIQNAASSLQVPFVDMPHAFDIHLINVVSQVKNNDGKVFYLGKGSPLLKDILNREQKTISSSDFSNIDSFFNRYQKIFSNGQTDLIVVYLDSKSESRFEQTDKIIHDIHRIISTETDNYVCVYTGLAYDNPHYNVDFGAPEQPTLKRAYLADSNSTNSTNTTTPNATMPVFRNYFGGWFWELFVTMLVMLPLLIIGTYSIDSIQTPLFEAKKKQ